MSHGRIPRSNRGRMVGVSAVVLTVVVSAIGAWFNGTDAVRAPEPASLRAPLSTSYGSYSAAAYLSGAPTTIVRWPTFGLARKDGTPRAGQPCTTTAMALWQTTTQIIHERGSLRLCMSPTGAVPAREWATLRSPLSNSYGVPAAAIYPSGVPTTIIRWTTSGQAQKDGTPRGGQPCTTTLMVPGQKTAKIIHERGSLRYCF